MERAFHYTLHHYKSARALGRENMRVGCVSKSVMRILLCGGVEGESESGSVSQSWGVIGFRILWEFKLVTRQSCRQYRCLSIAFLAAIVSKVTNQSPCHELGGSLYSVTECGVVAFVYEHKPVTDRASACISFHWVVLLTVHWHARWWASCERKKRHYPTH